LVLQSVHLRNSPSVPEVAGEGAKFPSLAKFIERRATPLLFSMPDTTDNLTGYRIRRSFRKLRVANKIIINDRRAA